MKPFGIAALVFSIVAIVIPVAGVFIAGLAGILALFSVGRGTTMGASAVIINLVNILFLSPSIILLASDKYAINPTHQAQSKKIFVILLVIQIVAIVVIITKTILDRNTGDIFDLTSKGEQDRLPRRRPHHLDL